MDQMMVLPRWQYNNQVDKNISYDWYDGFWMSQYAGLKEIREYFLWLLERGGFGGVGGGGIRRRHWEFQQEEKPSLAEACEGMPD